ncbi:exodeoxyribonuclease V subunit beta [Mangrovimonas sp. DI 80]|uniref:UvrD-helicase domain-containing protein n=1 Tax=Mangrovimonas sp. DI 80 TaxID=1779330 RepID=UPI000976FDDD|nr:UvrD-helicase domain-containing protein [Mangrovimonas sp. DI 80]OMP32414.1 DNA helicase UvrD [Mangrovimonas sp. DI 80]
MQNPSPFSIYNASAGSGKTYTLVKDYLKILVTSTHPKQFKHILAITFTNKAVGEMKERIINTLQLFAKPEILEQGNSMFEELCMEAKLSPQELHDKSKRILNAIVHNYASFDISTIDGFTHKLIRTFAHDLKLPLNFEVELDQNTLLNEAVDSLISKAGTNKELTKVLIDFAIEKADDDKSWDISFDFNKIAKLLINENELPFVKTFKDKSLQDFTSLKKELIKKSSNLDNSIKTEAEAALELIDESGLEHGDFTRGSLPKFFIKATDSNFKYDFGSTQWEKGFVESERLYPKKVTDNVAATIDAIQPQLIEHYNNIKNAFYQSRFAKAIYKNSTPLSVLNAIQHELTTIQKEQNKLLISEFNNIINNEIKGLPSPFIYERLGEKFRHYFIDEFQDTSALQWQNLIPLLNNTLASESGTAMLVGDAKQAIYRWRGGEAEQFIDLFTDVNPFQVEKKVENLPTNYRSFQTIVEFNNNLFDFISEHTFNHPTYQSLYQTASQNTFSKDQGYVNLSFLEISKDDDRDELYCQKTYESILTCMDNGFEAKDICVLVRKGKEGVAIADFLNEKGIDIVSSETLLIKNAPEVAFTNAFLKLLIQPKNNELKVEVLNFLSEKLNLENKHAFFKKHIPLEFDEFIQSLSEYGIFLDGSALLLLPLYDLVETVIRSFQLTDTSNAYIQFYLDLVLEYSQKHTYDLAGFISYFENKQDQLSIISPEGQNAVRIMTIHKSKGLEFPVVIFPYADMDIYRQIDPKVWFPLTPEDFNGFDYALLNYGKDIEHFGEIGQMLYEVQQAQLELDNINLLYVACTRPIEQLYIISKKDADSKGNFNNKTYAGILMQYLAQEQLWQDTTLEYTFGTPQRQSKKIELVEANLIQEAFISTPKEDHSLRILTKAGLLWETEQERAIEKGNLVHDIMALVHSDQDVDFALRQFLDTGKLNSKQHEELKPLILNIINHSSLKPFFNSDLEIYNERDIITKHGDIVRPDRVVINSQKKATIIDYKTGTETTSHLKQLEGYQTVLEDMGFKVAHKILVYINDDIHIKEF